MDYHSVANHSFADDLQLQMYALLVNIPRVVHSIRSCIDGINAHQLSI